MLLSEQPLDIRSPIEMLHAESLQQPVGGGGSVIYFIIGPYILRKNSSRTQIRDEKLQTISLTNFVVSFMMRMYVPLLTPSLTPSLTLRPSRHACSLVRIFHVFWNRRFCDI